jgi:branched-chain amino acid transport system substrate-binding protein
MRVDVLARSVAVWPSWAGRAHDERRNQGLTQYDAIGTIPCSNDLARLPQPLSTYRTAGRATPARQLIVQGLVSSSLIRYPLFTVATAVAPAPLGVAVAGRRSHKWLETEAITLRLGALVAVAALAVSACSSSISPQQANAASGPKCSGVPAGPIKLGEILPLSGPTAQNTTLAYLQIAVNYFNAHNSVCGHPFQIVSVNDKGDPATSLSEARQMVSSGITLMVDDSTGPPQNLIQPYLMAQHVVVMNSDARSDLLNPTTNPTAFAYQPSVGQYAQLMVNWAKAHNENDIGILNDGTVFSVEMESAIKQDLAAAGLTNTGTYTYSPTATDVTVQLTAAKEAGAKVLMLSGYLAINYIPTDLTALGWSPPIVSWGALSIYGIAASAVPAHTVDGCIIYYTPGKPESSLLTPAVTALLSASQAKLGKGPQVPGVVNAYDGLLVYKNAIIAANSLAGQKVAAAIENTTGLQGVVPGLKLSFSKTDHTGFPASGLAECTLTPGEYNILSRAS